MSESFIPSDLDEAIEFCQTAQPLRKIKELLDRTNLSADLKALLFDIAGFTVKIGEIVVAIGRRMISIALWLAQTIPNMTLGVLVALVLSTALPAIPLIGVLLTKLLVLLGATAGAIEDIRRHAMKQALDRVAAQFAAFKTSAVA